MSLDDPGPAGTLRNDLPLIDWQPPLKDRGRAPGNITVTGYDKSPLTDRLNPCFMQKRRKLVDQIIERWPKYQRVAGEIESQLADLGVAENLAVNEPTEHKPDDRAKLLKDFDRATAKALADTPAEVRRDAEALLEDEHLLQKVSEALGIVGVVGEKELGLTMYLIATSRLLQRPNAGIVQGVTSSGKSFTIERAAKLFPPEQVVQAGAITSQALYYMKGGLIHRFVVGGERHRIVSDEHAEATRAMREMLASGELHKLVPMSIDGYLETVAVHQHGPIAYLESTSAPNIDDEDANRCLLLATDERKEQTGLVVKSIAKGARYPATTAPETIALHHALQRMLKRLTVTVPYAERIADKVPFDRPEARRAMMHVISMIQSVALLRQRQRIDFKLEHGDEIAATLDDYRVARELLIKPIGRALEGSLPAAAITFCERLRAQHPDEFTSVQAAKKDPIISAKRLANHYLSALADAGCVEQVEPSRGSQPAKWIVLDEKALEPGAAWLPTLADLEAAE